MEDFERLGAFYLGKRIEAASGATSDQLVLYDSKDLTTHAVIVGMTGSGKTGLGVALIEEAAIDHVPVIAIDPKGDLGNLLLTFPALEGSDFEPWVDPAAATAAGQDRAAYAAATAKLWRSGLEKWGQSAARIAKLREAAEFSIYTPGSAAGRPISILDRLAAPDGTETEDADLFRERVQATVQGLLTLLGIQADPLTSREHILLATILADAWSAGRSLDLAGLIGAIQKPGIKRIGVMDLESYYPARERFALAMRLNNLLAAPGFDIWTRGEPLDLDRLLYTSTGRPRVVVMHIAHLGDAERMFFVTMLLAALIAWMRKQPGSASLRAMLYMDEIAGYLPPVANPPSKPLFLTLLKQARAYGVGLALATQNPVDLDYKALSNAGTWFVGRLQTEKDKERLRDGLASAAGSENLDPKTLDAELSLLGKRRFLLHNVHDRAPVLFETRWVMSYLAGPLTREQIKHLAASAAATGATADVNEPSAPRASATASESPSVAGAAAARPVLTPEIAQFFLPTRRPGHDASIVYRPYLLAAATAHYGLARQNIDETRQYVILFPAGDGAVAIDWDDASEPDVALEDLSEAPEAGASFAAVPETLGSGKAMARLESQFKRWLRSERPLVIYRSPALKEYSTVGETERDFRIRLQRIGNEIRDTKIAALRKRFDGKFGTLQNRLARAEHVVARESEQARGHQLDTAISFGTALLGAMLGRKRLSVTSATRIGAAAKKAGGLRRESGDVDRAKENVARIQEQIAELESAFEADARELDAAYDAQLETLKETSIAPKSADIAVSVFGIGWLPG